MRGVDSPWANHLEAEHNLLKQELRVIYENRGNGSIVRSKTRWIEQCEKLTIYFFNLEKQNYNHKELKHPEGKSVTEDEEILQEIEIFYKEPILLSLALKMRHLQVSSKIWN